MSTFEDRLLAQRSMSSLNRKRKSDGSIAVYDETGKKVLETKAGKVVYKDKEAFKEEVKS